MKKNRESVSKKQKEEQELDYFKVPDNYNGPEEDITEENTTAETWEKLKGKEDAK